MVNNNIVNLHIDYINIEDIVPYKNNPKKHPRAQIMQIEASIREFGMNDPIAVDEKTMTIIEGHGRLAACMKLGLEMVPVIKLGHLTVTQQKAYRIAHNKINLNSDFDMDKINEEIKSIIGEEDKFDIEITGFDKDMLERMEFINEFEKYDDKNCVYPIVPKYGEKYDAIIIVTENATDCAFVKNALGCGKRKSYKNSAIGETNVISAKEFIEIWKKNVK